MIADLKPYPEYKESGLPWLGQVPGHWEVRRTKAILREVDRRSTTGSEPLLSLRMQSGLVDHHSLGGKLIPPSALVGYKRVLPGEIVMNRMRAAAGLFAAATSDGLVSPDYAIFRPACRMSVAYAVQLFRTPAMTSVFRLESRGLGTGESGFLRLYSDRFGMLPVPFPPPAEQAAIVRFLDWANGRLERAIRAKRKVIALLNEQKQAIIHRAVTRGLPAVASSKAGLPAEASAQAGLDPSLSAEASAKADVPLKPSGIPWLGDIPQHWEVATIGAAATLIQTGPFGSQLHSHEYVSAGTPVINPSHMAGGRLKPSLTVTIRGEKARELSRHILRRGDIVIARRGELGRCALVTAKEEGWICGTGSLLLRCNPSSITPAFFQVVFSSRGSADMLSLVSIGATMANLNAGMVARQRLPLPPLDEQEHIVRFIENETDKVGTAISRCEREIELLREYRTRLVADVVTGKLDVREAAVRLPDEVAPDSATGDADSSDETEFADAEAAV